jgi:hypothetical protein
VDSDADLLTLEAATDIAERLYGTWNEEGPEGLAREFWEEDLVWHDDPSWPDARVVRGRKAVAEHLNEVMEGLGDFKMSVLEVLPFRGAVAGVRVTSTGVGSGVPIEGVIYHVARLRGGRFTEVKSFLKRDDALAAAGLE